RDERQLDEEALECRQQRTQLVADRREPEEDAEGQEQALHPALGVGQGCRSLRVVYRYECRSRGGTAGPQVEDEEEPGDDAVEREGTPEHTAHGKRPSRQGDEP